MTEIFLLFGCVGCALLGIDYGSQFNKAVLLAPGASFELVLTDEGKRKDLSGLCIRENKNREGLERLYGSTGGSLYSRFPQNCIVGVNELLGKSVDDKSVAEYRENHVGLHIAGNKSRNNAVFFDLGLENDSYLFSAEEVMAMNLQKIKSRALSELEHNPNAKVVANDVVVSIPPFATAETRQAYRDAVKLAGFSNFLGFVDEGSAVALNYASNKKFESSAFNDEKEYHLVYDMGAGSTKATLFSLTACKNKSVVVDVESVGYDMFLGGQTLTHSLYEIILESLKLYFNVDSSELSPKSLSRLMEAAEKAKIVLSVNGDYHVSLENIYDNNDFKMVVTKEEFETKMQQLRNRISQPIKDSIQQAIEKVSLKLLRSIILTGGSSRVPFIQNKLLELVGEKKLAKSVNADESCALGTTFRGFQLMSQFEKKNRVKIIEHAYHDYRLSLSDDKERTTVFPKGTIIGDRAFINLGPLKDKLSVNLYEGDDLFKVYEYEGIVKSGEQINCGSKSTKQLYGTFLLDHNRMFELEKLEVQCVNNRGILEKILNKETEEEIADEEVSNGKETSETLEQKPLELNETKNDNYPKKKGSKRRVAEVKEQPKTILYNAKLIPEGDLIKSWKKLAYLNKQDQVYGQLDHAKNILEAKCYGLRALIEENEERIANEMSAEKLAEYSSYIIETIEWLEFESEKASLKSVEKKSRTIGDMTEDLKSLLDIYNVNLSFSNFARIYEESRKVIEKIEEFISLANKSIDSVRVKFAHENFDFNKEAGKINLKSSVEESYPQLLNSTRELQKSLDVIGRLLESDKLFNKLSKREKYDIFKNNAENMSHLLSNIFLTEQEFQKNNDFLNKKFDTLLERKNKKSSKDKLKSQRNKQEESTTDNENKAPDNEKDEVASEHTTSGDSSTIHTSIAADTTTISTPENPGHDRDEL